MKCTDSALGASSCLRVRLPATRACAIIWPPKVRIGFLLGWLPRKVSSPVRRISRTASSCSKSLTGKCAPGSVGGLLTASYLGRIVGPAELVVVLADPVHVDHVGRAYCARRCACDDDHQITALVPAEFQQ